jgi:hypothetical protein
MDHWGRTRRRVRTTLGVIDWKIAAIWLVMLIVALGVTYPVFGMSLSVFRRLLSSE